MDRHVWTDERIDDMVDRLDKNIDLLREEMRAGFVRMDDGFASLRGELLDLTKSTAADHASLTKSTADGFTSLRHQMLQAVLVMSGMLVAAMVTILAKTL